MSAILYEAPAVVGGETYAGVARVTLNAPEKRNALNYAMVNELTDALRQADADPSVRVILLTAAGDHFSAGGNLKEFAAELDESAVALWASGGAWEAMFDLAPRLAKPIVAAVQGYALAGGAGLVALADLAVAAADAEFGCTEIRIGLFPLMILPALRRAVGEKRALEMALTGRMVEAHEAAAWGLVNRVVPRAELETTALRLAVSLAAASPEAMRLGKYLFYATADMSYHEALTFGRTLRATYMHSADLREGITAFLAKRKPQW
ncbi:MAG: enoyl-CoA hydratase-related protein [Anaerolineae bacterium]